MAVFLVATGACASDASQLDLGGVDANVGDVIDEQSERARDAAADPASPADTPNGWLDADAQDPRICAPGHSRSCFCPQGEIGQSFCNNDGTAWGSCLGCADASELPPDVAPADVSQPDMAPDVVSSGACLGPADRGEAERIISQPGALLSACLPPCVTDPNIGACVTRCVEDRTALSGPCAACFGTFVQCVAGNCLFSCQGGFDTQACVECVAGDCGDPLELCSGLDVGG